MSNSTDAGIVETYRFTPDDLRADARTPGISAFMRIRNGADFLEATIRSHIGHFDEIVAVHNQCTDATPDILARLAAEFGPERLRVFHYLPKVYPPGSEGHAKEPADSPASFVNMSNFALTRTRHRIVTKLDDDHLAMEQRLADLVRGVRAGTLGNAEMACFSGLNLARDSTGRIGIYAPEPFSGSGDIGFFPVSLETRFTHDKRFERFRHHGLRRCFGGIVYWHLKYLKAGQGFANRDIEAGNTRFARKRARFLGDQRVVALSEFVVAAPGGVLLPFWLLPEKARLTRARRSALLAYPPAAAALDDALRDAGVF